MSLSDIANVAEIISALLVVAEFIRNRKDNA
jgi:hypothetical protein